MSKIPSTMQALLAGRFDDAERLIGETGDAGRRQQAASLEFYSDWQLFALRSEQGRLGELEGLVERWLSGEANLGRTARFAAVRHVETGQEREAREDFEIVAAGNFGGLPRNSVWIHTLCVLSEVCAFLGDADQAEILYVLLLPYAERYAAVGDVLCGGAVARYLGILASTRQMWDAADAHLARGILMDTRLGAQPSVAYGRYERARCILSSGASADQPGAADELRAVVAAARDLHMVRLEQKALGLLERTGNTADPA
jgi:hypothetical protein